MPENRSQSSPRTTSCCQGGDVRSTSTSQRMRRDPRAGEFGTEQDPIPQSACSRTACHAPPSTRSPAWRFCHVSVRAWSRATLAPRTRIASPMRPRVNHFLRSRHQYRTIQDCMRRVRVGVLSVAAVPQLAISHASAETTRRPSRDATWLNPVRLTCQHQTGVERLSMFAVHNRSVIAQVMSSSRMVCFGTRKRFQAGAHSAARFQAGGTPAHSQLVRAPADGSAASTRADHITPACESRSPSQ